MKSPRFLKVEEVVLIHEAQINENGGLHGIRDAGLLDSAVNAPQASFGGEYLYEDIPAQAAAYLYHIVKNHPFLDGNKRTGAAATLIFLKMNGVRTPWSDDEFFELTLQTATSQISKEQLITIFRYRLIEDTKNVTHS
jgi:death on curing protein